MMVDLGFKTVFNLQTNNEIVFVFVRACMHYCIYTVAVQVHTQYEDSYPNTKSHLSY